LKSIFFPLFEATLRRPWRAVLVLATPVAVGLAMFPLLGSEFMPKLEEGNLWIRGTLPMSISLEESAKQIGRFRDIVRKHPEVTSVNSQLGRPDDGTDIAGFHNMEIFAPLKPSDQWARVATKEKLTQQISAELEEAFPGAIFNFSQYLSDNVDEALSGVKGENSVKVFGPNIEKNEATADAIVDEMAKIKGVTDLGLFLSMGQPSIKIVPDRLLCERYGLNTGDVVTVVQATVGGQALTQVYEGEKNFALTVRWKEAFRNDVAAIRRITVASSDGSQIPLAQLAAITEEDSPSVVYREDGQRYSPVKFSVRGRDLGSTVAEARSRIVQNVPQPPETHYEWAGQMNELKEAMRRLGLIIPFTLLLIGFLAYSAVRNWLDTLLVLLSIPLACSGGVVALLLAGENFSVSAAMGFISIFGIGIQGAILIITYAQRQWGDGKTLVEGALAAAQQRFRPVLMTTLVATLGLLPAALSNGIGAQSQKPLAILVIGGSLTLAFVMQLLMPPLMVVTHRWMDRRAAPTVIGNVAGDQNSA
jgi:heavy metal efflux system protein